MFDLMLALQPLVTPDIVRLLVVLVVIGFCLWLIRAYVPMDAPIKTAITGLVVLLLVLWILRIFGII